MEKAREQAVVLSDGKEGIVGVVEVQDEQLEQRVGFGGGSGREDIICPWIVSRSDKASLGGQRRLGELVWKSEGWVSCADGPRSKLVMDTGDNLKVSACGGLAECVSSVGGEGRASWCFTTAIFGCIRLP